MKRRVNLYALIIVFTTIIAVTSAVCADVDEMKIDGACARICAENAQSYHSVCMLGCAYYRTTKNLGACKSECKSYFSNPDQESYCNNGCRVGDLIFQTTNR